MSVFRFIYSGNQEKDFTTLAYKTAKSSVPNPQLPRSNMMSIPSVLFAVSTLFAVTTSASPGSSEPELLASFARFRKKFGKTYSPDSSEFHRRWTNFQRSFERIEKHNAQKERSWTMGLNQFSDMSYEEFRKDVLMAPQHCSATNGVSKPPRSSLLEPDLPESLDWREKNVISEVKNQGSCGSCWTFSTTGCLEAHLALKYQRSWMAPRLSEQQLVDCAGAFDTAGCNGGLPSHAFEYIKHAGGLSTEFSYPYTAKDGVCTFNKTQTPETTPFRPTSQGVGVEVPGGAVNITKGDEDSMKYFLAKRGPVSVAFQVASDFQHYAYGVYSSTVCESGAQDVNHAVLAVGYGTDPESKKPYWIIKNSWDYSWGASGYFQIEAFKNMCGIANCNSFPDLYGDEQDVGGARAVGGGGEAGGQSAVVWG